MNLWLGINFFLLLIDLRLSFTSIRTAYTNELSLDKEQTSYEDLLDALRLSLKGYEIDI